MLEDIPDYFLSEVQKYTSKSPKTYLAKVLWQRGIRETQLLKAFFQPDFYQPGSFREFGAELDFALNRIKQAIAKSEKITIWGDFEIDGITSTAVLWSGLQEFLPADKYYHLDYYIPNRLTESHGLNCAGITKLASRGTKLIITCDTGSTSIAEIAHAHELGLEVIITDHHTLPKQRPPVVAILNPLYFPRNHQLANLSGVAVAYKLIEALYEFLPELPQKPVTDLLDLVAIGLVSNLVQLTGDCRYLAQLGIKHLAQTPRLGLQELLKSCQKSGDRPTDIGFGIAPRLNAIIWVHEDAGVLVEFLTSTNQERVNTLAEQVELANTRRKALEKDTLALVKKKINYLDLSTTRVIVLADSQWQVGILGLVAGKIAEEYSRPTILFHTEELIPQEVEEVIETSARSPFEGIALARGSARSFGDIDLYELVASQAQLLHNFGGHPFAAELSLPVDSLPLFTEVINQQLRQKSAINLNHQLQNQGGLRELNRRVVSNYSQIIDSESSQIDLIVTVAELGLELYQELKLLEPCGMGNPSPKLLIKSCQFKPIKSANISDIKGKKVSYLKTEFDICDRSEESGFPGVWWGHSKDDLPKGVVDAIVKLDYNNDRKRTQVELITLLPLPKNSPLPSLPPSTSLYLPLPPIETWKQLLGIAKYLSRTGGVVTIEKLQRKLGLGNQSLVLGLTAITTLGFEVNYLERGVGISHSYSITAPINSQMINIFFAAMEEEQFRYSIPQSLNSEANNLDRNVTMLN